MSRDDVMGLRLRATGANMFCRLANEGKLVVRVAFEDYHKLLTERGAESSGQGSGSGHGGTA